MTTFRALSAVLPFVHKKFYFSGAKCSGKNEVLLNLEAPLYFAAY
jgi:hypothetical protein